jgi:hypothetical protein
MIAAGDLVSSTSVCGIGKSVTSVSELAQHDVGSVRSIPCLRQVRSG